MRRLRIRSMSAVLFAAVAIGTNGFTTILNADDASQYGKPNQEYLDQKAELEKMVTDRDVDLFELSFVPLDFSTVLIKDRLGVVHGYNYLTFRLRNEVVDATRPVIAKPSRYNEVLKTLADQYEYAKKSDESGGKLTVETTSADPNDGVILERQNLKPRTRSVSITVVVTDEHGSRLRLLDDPIGSGSQENYNFPDQGERSRDDVMKLVREAVEEKASRRLHTVDEIRAMKLPPYDPTKLDAEGVAEGEVYGVVLFDRLSLFGHDFTVDVQGLSNKLRVRQMGPNGLTDAPEPKVGEVENYLTERVMRREFVLHYHRSGDEFFRNNDQFVLEKSGWEWVNSFLRLSVRKDAAYVRYYLNNISDDKDAPRPDVEKDFWQFYSDERTKEFPNAGDKLPDLEKSLQDRASDSK